MDILHMAEYLCPWNIQTVQYVGGRSRLTYFPLPTKSFTYPQLVRGLEVIGALPVFPIFHWHSKAQTKRPGKLKTL